MQMLKVAAILSSLAIAGAAQVPVAAQQSSDLQCTGKRVTIRLSAIKPGKLDLFKKAVADHKAWYAAHHSGTTTSMVRLIKSAGPGKTAWDDAQVMTVTTYDTTSQPAQDAAYAAFVKEYRDSSDLKEEQRGCML